MRAGICQMSPPTFFTWPRVYLSRDSFEGSLPALVLVKLPSSVAPLSILVSAVSSFAWRSGEFACSTDFCSAIIADEKQTTLMHTADNECPKRRIMGCDMANSPTGRIVEQEPLGGISVLLVLRDRKRT